MCCYRYDRNIAKTILYFHGQRGSTFQLFAGKLPSNGDSIRCETINSIDNPFSESSKNNLIFIHWEMGRALFALVPPGYELSPKEFPEILVN